jgi:hypothetical protein
MAGVVLALALTGTGAAAQSPASSNSTGPAAVADSVAEARMAAFVWRQLVPYIHAASLDSVRRGWRFELPGPSESALPWALIEGHFRLALRAREPATDDEVVHTLRVSPTRVSGDTARADVAIDVLTRCSSGARGGGYGNSWQPIATRIQSGLWRDADAPYVRHGDRRCG